LEGLVRLGFTDVAQERDRRRAFANAVMNLRFSQNAGNFLPSRGTISFSRRTLFYGISELVIYLGGLSSSEEQYDPSEHQQNAVHSKSIDLSATQFSRPQTFQYSLRYPAVIQLYHFHINQSAPEVLLNTELIHLFQFMYYYFLQIRRGNSNPGARRKDFDRASCGHRSKTR
jgi:hypothetical protein